jgi:hypothetical protein
MSTLTGTQIKNTYPSLLKLINNGSLQTSSTTIVSDGLGNATPLQLAETRIQTQYSASNIGLDLNFNNNTFTIGDYDFISTVTSLKVNVNGEQIITNSNGGFRGINLDFFNDSYQFGDIAGITNGNLFVVDNDNSIIKTMKFALNKGLFIDFTNKIYRFGDYGLSTNGTMLEVNENTEIISTKNINEPKGLLFDYNGAIYKFGDFNGYGNNTALIISDGNESLYTSNGGAIKGISFDYLNNFYTFGLTSDGITIDNGVSKTLNINSNSIPYIGLDGTSNTAYIGGQAAKFFSNGATNYCALGDYQGTINNTFLEVNDLTRVIQTKSVNPIGLKLDFLNKEYRFGDFNAIDNGTQISIDDANEIIALFANSKISLTGNGLVNPTPPASSTPVNYLVVEVNGIQYKIGLLNP